MRERCHDCSGPVVQERGPRYVLAGERSVTVEADYQRCTQCGEIYFRPGQASALERAAVDLVRSEDGLLSPEEIQAIRARYGFSEDDLERLIRARPPGSVRRWERGTIAPAGPADTLLRILRDRPDIVEHLARERGVPVRIAGGT